LTTFGRSIDSRTSPAAAAALILHALWLTCRRLPFLEKFGPIRIVFDIVSVRYLSELRKRA